MTNFSQQQEEEQVAVSTPSASTTVETAASDKLVCASERNVSIVRVTCSFSENPVLRKGVVELFQLYFEELLEEGCDLGFQGFQSEWIELPGKYDFQSMGGLFVAVESLSTGSLTNGVDDVNGLTPSHIVGYVCNCFCPAVCCYQPFPLTFQFP